MNSIERIKKLKKEIYNTVVNNNWQVTVILHDGQIHSGSMLKQRDAAELEKAYITILTDDKEEVKIHLKDIEQVIK